MSTKALTKAAAKRRNLNDPSFLTALADGGPLVWLSCIIMGLGNIAAGPRVPALEGNVEEPRIALEQRAHRGDVLYVGTLTVKIEEL